MKFILSRYGGHGLIFGKGKASDANLPEDQSFENVMDNHAFEMGTYSYLSSYQMLPQFMGAYKNLPKGAIKIAHLEHYFTEMMMQHDVTVDTSVYFSTVGYCNVFALYLKTNFTELEYMFGKISPSYDCVLMILAYGKNKKDVKNTMPQILHVSLMTLIYEMGIKDTECIVTPSKTALGKKIDIEKVKNDRKKLAEINNRSKLAEYLRL
jgi:hypothetical protein